jgi:catechol 2,3-dioxygenase-like lactoylglutathione lyase family enzyme
MKIRTIYFKVSDIAKAAHFWSELLQIKPHKDFDDWKEFMCGNLRLALLRDTDGNSFSGSGCVPVLELEERQITEYISRAKNLGAQVVFDGLKDPDIKSVVLRTPFGHEFELSKFHE